MLFDLDPIPSAEITLPVNDRGIAGSQVTLCGEWPGPSEEADNFAVYVNLQIAILPK